MKQKTDWATKAAMRLRGRWAFTNDRTLIGYDVARALLSAYRRGAKEEREREREACANDAAALFDQKGEWIAAVIRSRGKR